MTQPDAQAAAAAAAAAAAVAVASAELQLCLQPAAMLLLCQPQLCWLAKLVVALDELQLMRQGSLLVHLHSSTKSLCPGLLHASTSKLEVQMGQMCVYSSPLLLSNVAIVGVFFTI
jgi:hypothetical protein